MDHLALFTSKTRGRIHLQQVPLCLTEIRVFEYITPPPVGRVGLYLSLQSVALPSLIIDPRKIQ